MNKNFVTMVGSDGTAHSHPCHEFSGSAGYSCWNDVLEAANAGALISGRLPGSGSNKEHLTDIFLMTVAESGLIALPGNNRGDPLQVVTVGLPGSFPREDIKAVDDLLATKITRRP